MEESHYGSPTWLGYNHSASSEHTSILDAKLCCTALVGLHEGFVCGLPASSNIVPYSRQDRILVYPLSNLGCSYGSAVEVLFATHGLPETIISDNGSVFKSTEFASFVTKNGIQHLTSAPYHPASNGLAERAVQTLKGALRKEGGGENLETQIARFLFNYRITPHTTTGIVTSTTPPRTQRACDQPDS